jgi:hypothetical protein
MGRGTSGSDRRGFVLGAATAAATMPLLGREAEAAPSEIGQWSPVYPWPCVAIHMIQLDTRILTFADDDAVFPARNADFSKAFIVNIPIGGAPQGPPVYLPNKVTNLFCAGHSHLPGPVPKVLLMGGHEGKQYLGSADVTLFEYGAGYAWKTLRNNAMNAGRWYGTSTVMGNGEVVILSGSIKDSQRNVNPLPQVWQTNQGGGWRDLTNAVRKIPYYPTQVVAPNGLLYVTGRAQQTLYLDTAGRGSWRNGPVRTYGDRYYGSSTVYGTGKILMAGGGGGGNAAGGGSSIPPTATCEVIDLMQPNPKWRRVGSMRWARRHMNATVLPDGKTLVTGGSSAPNNDARQAVYAAEMWDPATEKWTTMASMRVPRMYHSTALLLPDGRVLSAGGGRPPARAASSYSNCEIYSPPYLFRGPRPEIRSAPATLTYSQRFTITCSQADQIRDVTLVRLGSVTHCINMDQRFQRVAFTLQSGVLQCTMNPTRAVVPPGPYMLHVLNAAGVPSVAKFVRIG